MKPSRFWMFIARLWFGKELRDALMECGDVSTAKRFLAEVDAKHRAPTENKHLTPPK